MGEEVRAASEPLHAVQVHWDVRIRARDGIELSANLWRPATDAPVPAILEMIPYGKDSWRRNTDVAHGEYWAARGYAFCRLDVRGTGSSGGIALDEYTEAETLDGHDAVEWLAAQPWCDGNVGMWGISYGGFTSIQVAKLRPPHLRAIAPVYATDDRYRDDVHVRGGCLTASELSQYAVSQLAMNAMPPDPAFWADGADWRERWLERLEGTPPWLLRWLREQTDGPYWRRGSLAPDYDAIDCAIFHIAGWNDSYVDPAFRMQERCASSPSRRTLVGNWVHSYPSDAYPGPNLDWLHELTRFFDRYLKGVDNGWDHEPGLVWFQRDYAVPEAFPRAWPGRWRAGAGFPVDGATDRSWVLASGGRLAPGSPDGGVDRLPHRATAGTSGALSWGAGWHPNGLARDLRPDEAKGLTYTTDSLDEPLEIIGFPRVELRVAASMPVATLVVRLSDVAPDGTSALVSTGTLNLTHRRSDEDPEPMAAGQVESVRIPLRATGYRWASGHRIRVTLLSGSWPALWPSPHAGELEIHLDASRLALPVLPPDRRDMPVPTFKSTPPDLRTAGGGTEDPPEWRIEEDVIRGTVTVHIFEGGSTALDDGRELYTSERLTMTASDAEPARTRFATEVVYRWRERTFATDIRATGTIHSDLDALDVDLTTSVTVDGEPFFEHSWQERIPRRLV